MKDGDKVMTADGPGVIVRTESRDFWALGKRPEPRTWFVVSLENDGRRKTYPSWEVEPLAEFA